MLNAAYAALSDPTRRAIVARLAHGEATVAELARPFTMTQPAISRHLKVLEDAGLIETRIDGTSRPRRLKPEGLRLAFDWLSGFREVWEARYGKLDDLLEDLSRDTGTKDAPR